MQTTTQPAAVLGSNLSAACTVTGVLPGGVGDVWAGRVGKNSYVTSHPLLVVWCGLAIGLLGQKDGCGLWARGKGAPRVPAPDASAGLLVP